MAASINSSPVHRERDLLGQTVLVIGGSSGIGLETARLAPQDGDPAPAGERVGHEPIQRLTLASASEELRGRAGILTRRRPPPRSTTAPPL